MPDSSQFKPRPTTYNGIEMRSRLEAKYAAWLDHLKLSWEYEPRCFADERQQYLPDFRVEGVRFLLGTPTIYVEVKPTLPLARTFIEDRPYEAIWASEPDAVVALEISREPHTMVALPASLGGGAFHCVWTNAGNQVALGVALHQPWREVA